MISSLTIVQDAYAYLARKIKSGGIVTSVITLAFTGRKGLVSP